MKQYVCVVSLKIHPPFVVVTDRLTETTRDSHSCFMWSRISPLVRRAAALGLCHVDAGERRREISGRIPAGGHRPGRQGKIPQMFPGSPGHPATRPCVQRTGFSNGRGWKRRFLPVHRLSARRPDAGNKPAVRQG